MNKLLFPILSLLAAVGLYFLYIGPTYDEIKVEQEKEAEFDNAFAEIQQVRDLVEELRSSYAGISREDLLRLEKLLPKQIDIPRVVQNIGGIVGSYGVPMDEIQTKALADNNNGADEGPTLVRHEIEFSIDAVYGDFLKILNDIESNIQLASVTQIELIPILSSEGTVDAASTKYRVTLTLYSYE